MNQSNVSFCSQPTSGQVIAHTFAYVVLLVVALVGNILVIFVIYRNKNLQNIVNCFILNISLSDLIVPIVIAPRKLIEITTGSNQWLVHGHLGNFLCKFVYYITDITPSVSVLSLVFMTGDRFYAVFFPMKASLIPKSYRIALVVLTWLIPITFFSPYFTSLEVRSSGTQHVCTFTWSVTSHTIFSATACVVYIIIPFTSLIALYSLILCKLKERSIAGGEELQQQKTQREKTNLAVIKLAFVVILVFALCWGPSNVIVFLYSFVWPGFEAPRDIRCTMHIVNDAVLFIAYSNTAINPLVYFILNRNYREGLKKALRRSSYEPTTRFTKNITNDGLSRARTSLLLEPLNREKLNNSTCKLANV